MSEETTEFDFDRETAVTPTGNGGYRCELSPLWSVHRGPNGGYLAAVALRALTEAVGDAERAPRSLTVHSARPPVAPGPLDIEVRVERAGRSLTSLSARLVQGDQLIGLALAAFSLPRPGPEFCDLVPPDDVPPPELCTPRRLPVDPSVPMPAIARPLGDPLGGRRPARLQGDTALAGGWIRLPEGRRVDALVVAAMTDGWVPPVFSRVPVAMVVPTVDLTIHFRTRLPLPDSRDDDWVLASFRTDAAADGFLEEDGSLWSRGGVLLAQSCPGTPSTSSYVLLASTRSPSGLAELDWFTRDPRSLPQEPPAGPGQIHRSPDPGAPRNHPPTNNEDVEAEIFDLGLGYLYRRYTTPLIIDDRLQQAYVHA